MRYGWLGVLALILAQDAFALKFRSIENDGLRRRVLLVYDCGWLAQDSVCFEHESGFSGEGLYSESFTKESANEAIEHIKSLRLRYEVDSKENVINYIYGGDQAELQRYLSGSRYDEVWLLSGGGQVVAGLGIGEGLRDNRMPVRVPSGARLAETGLRLSPGQDAECVSSCTIAFMGGLFRAIDDGATYQIHASSKYLGIGGGEKRLADIRERIKGRGLRAQADEVTKGSRDMVRDLLTHFHNTLLLPIRETETRAERRKRDDTLTAWVIKETAKLPYPQAELDRDEKLYELEGDPALQDILMRLERRAMAQALADVQPLLPQLGRRADAAFAIVNAMYTSSSIVDSSVMARETMVEMGYLTEDVQQ